MIVIKPDNVTDVKIGDSWHHVNGDFLIGEAMVVGGGGVLSGQAWFAFETGDDHWVEGPMTSVTALKEIN